VIGLFPSIFLAPMKDSVESVLARYTQGRIAWLEMGPEGMRAELLPKKGGPLEIGYPKSPEERKAEEEAKEQAMNAPAATATAPAPAPAPPGGH
jgi:hypothetical protein